MIGFSKYNVIIFFLCLIIVGFIASSCVQQEVQTNPEGNLLDTLLLRDWMPENVHKVPRTDVTKAQYPVIDLHAHAYARTEEDLDKRVEIMDATGIERSVVLTGATGEDFDELFELYSKYSDRFFLYAGLNYDGYENDDWAENMVEELHRVAEMGAVGIGEIHDKGPGLAPGMHPDDPKMDQIFEAAAELGLTVNLHVAEPIWMYENMDSTNDGLTRAYTWRVKNQDQIVDHDGMIEILDNTLERHPNTTFVAAHIANTSNDFSLIADLFDKHSNLYADISARFAEFGTIPRTTAAFFEEYQDRIVYGTDYGFETFPDDPSKPYGNNTTTEEMFRMTFRVLQTPDEHFYITDLVGYKWPLYGLDLSDEALRKIYRENALEILGD